MFCRVLPGPIGWIHKQLGNMSTFALFIKGQCLKIYIDLIVTYTLTTYLFLDLHLYFSPFYFECRILDVGRSYLYLPGNYSNIFEV